MMVRRPSASTPGGMVSAIGQPSLGLSAAGPFALPSSVVGYFGASGRSLTSTASLLSGDSPMLAAVVSSTVNSAPSGPLTRTNPIGTQPLSGRVEDPPKRA